MVSILQAFFLGIFHKKPFETHDSLVGWLVIVATIPALIVGFLLKDVMENLFNNPILVAALAFVDHSWIAGCCGVFGYP